MLLSYYKYDSNNKMISAECYNGDGSTLTTSGSPETPVEPEVPIENTPIEAPETFDPSDFNSSEESKVQENKGYGESGEKEAHGNSKDSTQIQHGYEIYDVQTGDVYKTGISGQKLNQNGTSPRANTQVNKLNKIAGDDFYAARVVKTDMPNRRSALAWEEENALKLWEEGNSLVGHKRPRPWEK